MLPIGGTVGAAATRHPPSALHLEAWRFCRPDMVPPTGGTVPGGGGRIGRRAFARRARCRQSAALYGRPIGRLKMGGGGVAPAEWRVQRTPNGVLSMPGLGRAGPPPGSRRAARCPAEFRRISCGAGAGPPGRMVPPMGGTVLAWRPSCLRSEARFVPGMVQPIGCTVSGGTVSRLRSRACGGGGLPPDRNGA